jgi:hypothetical protein
MKANSGVECLGQWSGVTIKRNPVGAILFLLSGSRANFFLSLLCGANLRPVTKLALFCCYD